MIRDPTVHQSVEVVILLAANDAAALVKPLPLVPFAIKVPVVPSQHRYAVGKDGFAIRFSILVIIELIYGLPFGAKGEVSPYHVPNEKTNTCCSNKSKYCFRCGHNFLRCEI